MRFHTTIEQAGKSATGFRVPADVVTALGAGRQPKVRVTIGAYSYPSSIARRGDRYLIPLSAAHRTAAGLSAGEEIDVDIALDTNSRETDLPEELAAALADAPDAAARFTALTPTQRGYFSAAVADAKTPETRARRVAKAIASLRAGQKRP